jgi:hypothetical protein
MNQCDDDSTIGYHPVVPNNNEWATSLINDAVKTLDKFISDYQDVEFESALIKDSLYGYEWVTSLITYFFIKLDNSKKLRVKVCWSDDGCSCNGFDDFISLIPDFTPNCIYQLGKWHCLESAPYQHVG